MSFLFCPPLTEGALKSIVAVVVVVIAGGAVDASASGHADSWLAAVVVVVVVVVDGAKDWRVLPRWSVWRRRVGHEKNDVPLERKSGRCRHEKAPA